MSDAPSSVPPSSSQFQSSPAAAQSPELQAFTAHVLAMEREAHANPLGYKLRIALIGGLAYVYIALLVAVTLGILGGIGYGIKYVAVDSHAGLAALKLLKIAIPVTLGLLAFVGVILRSLWVQFPYPDGEYIGRDEAVPLFQEIDRLRSAVGAPRLHYVLLTDEFNAAVYQRPRLGLFGWSENFLEIGIPLMATLSPDQFRSVLAHELGHVGKAHGRFGNWVNSVSLSWMQMIHGLEAEEHGGADLIRGCFNWYAPYFWWYTFGLRRAQEYEADHASAKVVGAKTAADALLTATLVEQSARYKRRPQDKREAQRWINEAMTAPEDGRDSHPSLASRLRALGQPSDAPDPVTETALTRYLGHRAQQMAAQVGIEIVFSGGDKTASSSPTPTGAVSR